jgi:cytochrome c553
MATLQNIVVFVLVGASVLLSLWWLTSARWRLWLIERLASPNATRGPLAALRRSLSARSALGGCGACKANPSANAQHPTQKAAGLRR